MNSSSLPYPMDTINLDCSSLSLDIYTLRSALLQFIRLAGHQYKLTISLGRFLGEAYVDTDIEDLGNSWITASIRVKFKIR